MNAKKIRVEVIDRKTGISEKGIHYPPGSVLDMDEAGALANIGIGRAVKTDKPLFHAPHIERGVSADSNKVEKAVLRK